VIWIDLNAYLSKKHYFFHLLLLIIWRWNDIIWWKKFTYLMKKMSSWSENQQSLLFPPSRTRDVIGRTALISVLLWVNTSKYWRKTMTSSHFISIFLFVKWNMSLYLYKIIWEIKQCDVSKSLVLNICIISREVHSYVSFLFYVEICIQSLIVSRNY